MRDIQFQVTMPDDNSVFCLLQKRLLSPIAAF